MASSSVGALGGEKNISESEEDELSSYSRLDKLGKDVAAAKKEAKAAEAGSPEQKQAQRRADEGIAVIEGMGNERPEDSRAQHAVGETLYTVGEYKRALPFAQREIELNPDKPGGYVLAALTLQKLGRNKDAHTAAIAALRRDPNDKVAFAVKRLTENVPDTEKTVLPKVARQTFADTAPNPFPDEGRDLFDAEAKTTANHIEAERFAKEAANKMKLGDTTAARHLLDKALALEPNDATKLALRSTITLQRGDAKAAFEDAHAAVAADSKLGLALVTRARAMAALMPEYTLGQVLADYAAAVELDPSYAAEYARALAQYGKGPEQSLAAPQGSNAQAWDISRKAASGGKQAQDRLWGRLPEQARKKWPQGLGVLAGGLLLLLWLRKKLRQTIPDKPWKSDDPSDQD